MSDNYPELQKAEKRVAAAVERQRYETILT
jgi:hypothetical protein